jgi:hypothetical protein
MVPGKERIQGGGKELQKAVWPKIKNNFGKTGDLFGRMP